MRLLRKNSKVASDKPLSYSIDEYLRKATVICFGCGCLVHKGREIRVTEQTQYGIGSIGYCRRCKPPYDSVYRDAQGKRRFFKNNNSQVEVDEEGNPVTKQGHQSPASDSQS